MTKDEVCPVDVIVFDALELKFPSAASEIRDNFRLYTITGGFDEECGPLQITSMREMTESKSDTLGGKLSGVMKENGSTGEEVNQAMSLLEFLFPVLAENSFLKHNHWSPPTRLFNRHALLTYFNSGPSSFTFSAKEAKACLLDSAQREHILEEKVRDGSLRDWISYLQGFLDEIETPEPIKFVHVFVDEILNAQEADLRQYEVPLNEIT